MPFLARFLLNLYFWPLFGVFTLVGLLLLPYILLGFRLRGIGLHAGLRRSIRLYGWFLVCFFPFFGPVTVSYRGVSKDKLAGVIMVANHNSAIDPYLFGAIPIENGFVTSWPFKIPLYRWFMRWAGYANTDDGWESVSKSCRRLLAAGSSVTIWPEGHRSRDGSLGRFKLGAFQLAVDSGRPVVPVCILKSGQTMPVGNRLLCPARPRLIVLPPQFPPQEGDPRERARMLRSTVRKAIEQALEQEGHFQQFRPERTSVS